MLSSYPPSRKEELELALRELEQVGISRTSETLVFVLAQCNGVETREKTLSGARQGVEMHQLTGLVGGELEEMILYTSYARFAIAPLRDDDMSTLPPIPEVYRVCAESFGDSVVAALLLLERLGDHECQLSAKSWAEDIRKLAQLNVDLSLLVDYTDNVSRIEVEGSRFTENRQLFYGVVGMSRWNAVSEMMIAINSLVSHDWIPRPPSLLREWLKIAWWRWMMTHADDPPRGDINTLPPVAAIFGDCDVEVYDAVTFLEETVKEFIVSGMTPELARSMVSNR